MVNNPRCAGPGPVKTLIDMKFEEILGLKYHCITDTAAAGLDETIRTENPKAYLIPAVHV